MMITYVQLKICYLYLYMIDSVFTMTGTAVQH